MPECLLDTESQLEKALFWAGRVPGTARGWCVCRLIWVPGAGVGSLGTEFLGTSPEERRAALLRPQLCAEELSQCPLQRAGQLAASDGRVGTDE